MRPKRRALTARIENQSFTTDAVWGLITEVSGVLDGIRRARRRDRWWFLRGHRTRLPEQPPDGLKWSSPPPSVDLRRGVIGHGILFERRVAGLSVAIRVRWNLGPRRGPIVLIEFRDIRRPRRGTGGTGADAGLFTIELGSDQRRGPAGIFTQRAVPTASQAWRKSCWRDYQTWRRNPRRTTEWEVLPEDGPSARWRRAATFWILVYLVQRDMIEFSPTGMPLGWTSAVRFIRGCGAGDDGEAAEVFQRLCVASGGREPRRYGFPNRPEGLVTYIRRVISDMRRAHTGIEISANPEEIEEHDDRHRRRRHHVSRTPRFPHPGELRSIDEVAVDLGVRRETIYRWAHRGKFDLTQLGARRVLDAAAIEVGKNLIRARRTRLGLMQLLTERCGMSPAAAKKRIQRGLQAGMTLEGIAARAAEHFGRANEAVPPGE